MSFESVVRGGGVLTQSFGQTAWACSCACEWNCPGRSTCRNGFHAGIDISVPESRRDPIYLLAVGYGKVVRIGRQTSGCGGLGPYAPCVRTGGVDVWYGHAAKCLVGAGTNVVPGQPIALMGSIGCSTGRHVHFEVLPATWDPNGCGAIDPWPYIAHWPGAPAAPPAPPPPRKVTVGPWLLAAAGVGLVLASRRAG